MDEVLVLAETKQGQVEKTTYELIQAAAELNSSLGGIVSCLLLGNNLGSLSEELARYPIQRLYCLEHKLLEGFLPDIWVSAVEQVLTHLRPMVFVMSHSPIAKEIGPRLAARFNSTLTTDCIGIRLDPADKRVIRTKPIYGGNAVAVLKGKGSPELITIRKNVYNPAVPDGSKAEVVRIDVQLSEDLIKARSREVFPREQVELDKAEVIVSGGRGITTREDFELLERISSAIAKRGVRSLVGCSRPIVDKGWMSSDHQVGLTGTMVAPGLYLAVGISGAIQHLVGMVRSKKIIAINTDPNCNMFKVADYGILGDYKEVLPHLIERLEGKP